MGPAGRFTVFTVDDLFELPDWGLRAEVLDGRLLLAPPQPRRHARVADTLAGRFRLVLPTGVAVRRDDPVRLPGGDGPVPDLFVCTDTDWPRGVPARDVHTVVEVVSADGRHIDRVWKRDGYARAGVPCYWRVEQEAWPGYRGPLPVVTVRLWDGAGWRELVAPAGRLHTLPLAYARDLDGGPACVPVRLDPGTLVTRRATTR